MSNVTHLPPDVLINQGRSQRDRILEEVMANLFDMLPDRGSEQPPTFTLKDGTECRVCKFSRPKYHDDGVGLQYGFDVKFDQGLLHHLEFYVRCTGWGGGV